MAGKFYGWPYTKYHHYLDRTIQICVITLAQYFLLYGFFLYLVILLSPPSILQNYATQNISPPLPSSHLCCFHNLTFLWLYSKMTKLNDTKNCSCSF
jgi:hypothetical protein